MGVVDPQWLVDRINAVIRDYALHEVEFDQEARIEMGESWERLRTQGIVSERLLRCLWQRHEEKQEHLTKLLCHLGLICPMRRSTTIAAAVEEVEPVAAEEEDGPLFLVPSVLPRQDYEPLNTAGLVVEAHECWLRFSIKASEHSTISLHFLPESLWARLLVRCVQFEMLSGPPPRLTSDWATCILGRLRSINTGGGRAQHKGADTRGVPADRCAVV